jgi:proteic killer suppression protein
VIKSFRNEETRQLFLTGRSKKFGATARAALRKLNFLESASRLEELKDPPGNRLEKLRGDRAGQYSMRINDQYRLCFRWHEQAAWDVEVADYH